jgi:starvation-inducible DNA-binding protein
MQQLLDRPEAETPVRAGLLQDTLVELIDLSLQAKQAHWNVVGPAFRPLHEFLDEMTDQYRGWYDDVAERLTAIGVGPDGRVGTVASSTSLPKLPEGPIADGDVPRFFDDRVSLVIGRLRDRIEAVASEDLVSQDLLIEIARGLEKQRWMLRAHRA